MNRPLGAQRGFSMVELMVAITIGLILTAGVLELFANNKNAYRVDASLARVQESGRMALDSMANDIRMAGYWGCQPSLAKVKNDLNAAGTGYINFGLGALGGSEGGGAPDSITLRGADSTPGLVPQPNAGGGTTYNPSTSAAPRVAANTFNTNDIVLVSDCTGGDFFQVTGTGADALGGFDINHANGGGSPGNSTAAFAHVYAGDANIYYAHQIQYYVATKGASSGVSTVDGQSALWRSVNGSDQELVDDVTDLQIWYGEDMNGDRSVDRYVQANAPPNFANVYSVKIQVTVQTADASTSVTAGTRIKHTFSTVVAIRNRVL